MSPTPTIGMPAAVAAAVLIRLVADVPLALLFMKLTSPPRGASVSANGWSVC